MLIGGGGGQLWKCTKCEGGGEVKILRHRSKSSTFPSRVDKKIRSGGSLPATKFCPYIKSLAHEPINYFYYQEFSVHVRTYAYACAYSWNLEKIIPESIFINKLRWLINILHYTVVLVLVNPLSFYWLGGVKWNRMWSHRPWLRLLTKPTPILSRSICSSHNVVGLSCVRNMHSLASLQRYEESANSFTKDYDRGEIELSCSLALCLSKCCQITKPMVSIHAQSVFWNCLAILSLSP